ncbi:MAG: hypothetical protein WC136_03710 [Sphaerochaeta sp.]
MKRYDDVNSKEQVEAVDAKKVIIDLDHMPAIHKAFTDYLKDLILPGTDKKIFKKVANDFLIFNDISDEDLANIVKEKVTKLEFVKKVMFYNMDNFINIAYGEPVVAIQEFPYMFETSPINDQIIKYEFIIN